ncbi:MAG: hypothetical protein SangKO_082500 [Sandaracinaceae bacterium]
MSRELDEETARFRPSVRPFLIAAAVNVLLGAVLLGIPYSRGPDRAGEVPGRFAAFTACLFDGEALEDPGLGLPSGERARYASLVVATPAPTGPRAACRSSTRSRPRSRVSCSRT